MNLTTLTDSLTNGCRDNLDGGYLNGVVPAEAYARGITNGIVSALMASGWSYHDAIKLCKSCAPKDGPHGAFEARAVPTAWRDDWEEA